MSEHPRLTEEQERAAARREGSLLLAAGAGSGKTSVLVERFARAVVEDGIAPARILAISFTERAAGELRERLRARLLQLGEREAARRAEAAFVGTFHGFCARVLRAHPLQAGIDPSFRILEESFSSRLRRQAFAETLGSFLTGERERAAEREHATEREQAVEPEQAGEREAVGREQAAVREQAVKREQAVELAAAYGADALRAMVLDAYAQLRSQGQLAPRLPLPPVGAVGGEEEAIAACLLIDELLERFGEVYARLKRERAALDFDDLELLAGELLASGPLREAWAQRFELLMVDEFQDTNRRQLRILAALDRDNLFTVGDELQSIYSFRHAEVALFRERGERLAEQEAALALTRNFRSRPPILLAVRRMFAERMAGRFAALAPTREPASASEPAVELLIGNRAGGPPPPAASASTDSSAASASPDPPAAPAASGAPPAAAGTPTPTPLTAALPAAPPWRQAEARLLAARIGELLDREGVAAGDVAVLLRALGDLPLYEAALNAAAIPTVAAAGGFWSHQQVGDLLAWLRALANPLDELALYSVLASPLAGLSSDALALIATFAREQGVAAWQAIEHWDGLESLLREPDRERLARARVLLADERRGLALRPIADLLARAIAASGYERHLRSREWGERRIASVHKLLRLARSFEAQEGRDLRAFLDHVAHVEEALAGREAEALSGERLEAVRLMSIHAAKGLEFPVVCVADLGREPNLRQGELLVDAGGRVGLRLLSTRNPEAAPALAYEELREQRRRQQLEEEDRVLYVACTRARERLILSGAAAFDRWPPSRPGSPPIAWLAPALVPDVAALAAAHGGDGGPVTISVEEGLRVRCLFGGAAAGEPAAAGSGGSGGRALGTESSVCSETLEQTRTVTRPSGNDVGPPPQSGRPAERAQLRLGPEAAVSYTSLVELERCGYRYYLERVLRMPERRALERRADEGLDPRLRGTIVHALLERVDFADPAPVEEAEVQRVARLLGARVPARERAAIVELLARALASEPAERLRGLPRGRRERPFAFSLGAGEPLIGGVVDLIVELPDDRALIVDYKSDRLAAEIDLERLVERDYAIQRQVYALAALEGGAAEVEVAHWFLERPGGWVSARFAAEGRDRLRERLRNRLAAARERGYAVTEQPHRQLCFTCPGRGGMCSWGETHTMRAHSSTLAIDE